MIGKRLREARNRKEMSQEELAKILEITTSAVGLYETDARNPSYQILAKISNYFCVSADWLLGISNNENQSCKIPDGYALAVSDALEKGITPDKLRRLISFAKELEQGI